MAVNLSGRSFLKLLDFTSEEITYLIDLAQDFKALKRDGTSHRYLEGKNIVLLFQKTSTRTRCSFEVAAFDLGMGVTYLDPSGSQMGTKESVEDTARVLGRLYDGIEFRGYKQSDVEELAEKSGVPVWNGLTDEFHPTQMIADMLTIRECFSQGLQGLKLVFFGDCRNNVAHSLMVVCAKLGLHFVGCGPKDLRPAQELIDTCQTICRETGASVFFTDDPCEAAADADVIYTDIWLSMGEPEELWVQRIEALSAYQVTSEIMDCAHDHAIFLHCLPSFHDANTIIGAKIAERFGITEMEVTDEVFESDRSRVFDEAENRMHSIKAIMYATLR